MFNIIDLISDGGLTAALISISINVLISVVGVLPSIFITLGNILVFGIYKGFLISWIGEVTGALLSLLLYRWGLKSFTNIKPEHLKLFRMINKLSGTKQLYFLSVLRMAPFIPSGLINFFAALTTVPLVVFLLATALGKIPALMLEVAFSYHLVTLNKNYLYFAITIIIAGLLYFGVRKEIKRLENS